MSRKSADSTKPIDVDFELQDFEKNVVFVEIERISLSPMSYAAIGDRNFFNRQISIGKNRILTPVPMEAVSKI